MCRSFSTLLVLCLAAVLSAAIPASAQPTSCNAEVKVWPLGPSYAVALDGTRALLGRGRELTVVSIAAPNTQPLPILGRVTLPGQVRAIALSPTVPGLAAVAMDTEGVALVDVSTPSAPVMTRHFAVGGRAYGLAFGPTDGGFLLPPIEMLFVARLNLGIQIVEYDNPSGAVLRGSFTHTSPSQSNSADVVVDRFELGAGFYGYRAFVADQNAGVTVLNVANPDFPTLIGGPIALSGSAAARSLLLHRDGTLPIGQTDRLFVAAGSAGLRAFSIVGAQLATQYALTLPNAPYDVEDLARDGLRLVAAASYGGARVIDISDLANLTQLATTGSTAGRVHGAAAGPANLFLAAEQAGLLSYQIVAGPPMSLTVRASVLTAGTAYDAAANDRYAFVTDFSFGLNVVDLLAPGGPTQVSPPFSFGFSGFSVALSGTLALVGDFNGNLHVLDVSTPSAPAELGVVNVTTVPGGYLGSIAVSGTHAFVTALNAQLFASVDFSNPATPVVQDTVPLGASPRGVVVNGNLAYIALDGTSQLAVVDVADPANLVLQSAAPLSSAASDIALGGGIGLLSRGNQLTTLGLSSPAVPVELGSTLLTGTGVNSLEVAAAPGFAHLVGSSIDLAIGTVVGQAFAVDVRTPATPVAAGAIRSPAVRTIAPAGDRLITANLDLGATLISNCSIVLRDGFEDGVPLPGRWSSGSGN